MKNQSQDYYTPYQLKLPVDLATLIDISDPVYTFCEVMNHIDLNVWLSKNGLTHFISIANLVYIHIRSENFWKIDDGFIETLGSAYFSVLAKNRK